MKIRMKHKAFGTVDGQVVFLEAGQTAGLPEDLAARLVASGAAEPLPDGDSPSSEKQEARP